MILARYEDELGQGGGWTFQVPERRRAHLRVEYTHRWRSTPPAVAGRITLGDRILAWYAVGGWWDRVGLAVSTDATSPAVLPPIPARAARPTDWVRTIAERLDASPRSPLHGGTWWIGTDAEWPFHRHALDIAEAIARPPVAVLVHFEWRLLPLRPFADTRRAGFWQKQIQTGHLPPIVLLAVSPIEMFAVLDGHDRLLAAHREGVGCPFIIVAPLRTHRWPEDERTEARRAGVARQVAQVDWEHIQPPSQDKLNRAVIQAWARPEHTFVRTRCWPVPGGLEGWHHSLPPGGEALPALLPTSLVVAAT